MDNRFSEVLREVVIDNFSEYIQTSSKVMPKPYIQGKVRVPLKYQNDEYEFRRIKYRGKFIQALVHKVSGLMVVSNTKTVDRPREVKVNGQDIYNQNAFTFGRSKIVEVLHKYFHEKINWEPISDVNNYPLAIEMIFVVNDMGKRNVDNDNKWIWRKCLQDTIVRKGIIPDDNVYNIVRNMEETVLVPEGEPQKLIIRVYGQKAEDN